MKELDHLGIREYLIGNCGFKSFNHIAWMAYPDSVKFDSLNDPIIKHKEELTIIYDKNGFHFYE
jgi:hypothetical protein